jgi:hypothetical protein
MDTTMERSSEAVASERVPVLAVRHGRGRTGGTTLLNFLIERGRRSGRTVLVGDGDRRNATLAGLYPPGTPGGASQPSSDETADVKDWIRSLVGSMVEIGASLVLDMGAGDQALAEACRELDLVEFCASVGVEPLFLGSMGPDMEDFDHLLMIMGAGFFNASHTVLVMNEHLVRNGKTPVGAFDAILGRPELGDIAGRGVKFVRMPHLIYMEQIRKAGLSFYDVAAGKKGKNEKPMDPLAQFAAGRWIEALERQFEANGIGEWLP